MATIPIDERRLIEAIKTCGVRQIAFGDVTLTIKGGDKLLAHDIALAYQSFVIRKINGK